MSPPRDYFPSHPGEPEPLTATARRRVRFEEVDMLNIAWHGHYVSFLDDGRVAFGDRYPVLSYRHLHEVKVAAPIVQLHLDYQAPLFFDEEMTIAASLHWSEAVRMNFSYLLTGLEGRLVARAWSVQLLVDEQRNTLLVPPDWFAEFREQWRQGKLA
jgi:acyl-CoA thioester hydrolase